jgi:hypothetical protein
VVDETQRFRATKAVAAAHDDDPNLQPDWDR